MFANAPHSQVPSQAERQQLCQAEVQATLERLTQQYGFQLGATLRTVNFTEQDFTTGGTVNGVKTIAALSLTPVDGWQPPGAQLVKAGPYNPPPLERDVLGMAVLKPDYPDDPAGE